MYPTRHGFRRNVNIRFSSFSAIGMLVLFFVALKTLMFG